MTIKLENRKITLTELELLEVVNYWYTSGIYPDILQDENGRDLEEVLGDFRNDLSGFDSNSTIEELFFKNVISCRLNNVIRANFTYEGFNPKVKDLYPISIKQFKRFRNVGKGTVEELINLYQLLDIKIID